MFCFVLFCFVSRLSLSRDFSFNGSSMPDSRVECLGSFRLQLVTSNNLGFFHVSDDMRRFVWLYKVL